MSASDLQSGSRAPKQQREVIVSMALGGAFAGFCGGLVDGLWSFAALSQYLPSLVGKLSLLLHLGLSYAFATMVVGVVAGGIGTLVSRQTRMPEILRTLRRQESTHDGSFRLATLSLAVVGTPLLFLASSSSFAIGLQTLATRKHPGLIVAVSLGIVLIAILGMLVLTLLLAALVEKTIATLPEKSVLSRILHSKHTATLTFLALFVLCTFILRIRWSSTTGLPTQTKWLGLAALGVSAVTPWTIGRLLRLLWPQSSSSGREELNSAYSSAQILLGIPLLATGLGAAYLLAARTIASPPPVLIVTAMSYALLFIAVAALISCAFATWLAPLLHRSIARLGITSAAARSRMPLLFTLLLLVLMVAALFVVSGKTLHLLPLRPFWISALLLVFATQTVRGARRLSGKLFGISPWPRRLALASFAPLLFVAILGSGSKQSVRKAQVLHSGLGEPLARVYRVLGDWDRDGYSRWLGGGDCDDGNSRVHPGADEVPFDGIDNNCLGGDVTDVGKSDTHFSDVPKTVPGDFNVVFITIDTIRADHLGAYGYERNTTPNIDALAASGTLFQNGWAHAPSTRYSIPAMLTGRYPLKVRYFPIRGQWPGISEENLTIAEVMKERGLTTGAILNYWYFDTKRKMNQGFDFYDNENKRLHKAVGGKGPAETKGSSSKEQSDKALAFVEKHKAERFFLWVHYYDPHFDYEKHPGTESFGDDAISAYDHEIAFTDKHIGRLLDGLKAQGLHERTIVVLTGDHGEGFGEHGIDLHGYHLYAAQTKVPLIIRVPGVEASVVEMPASHVDILPTLANLSGFPKNSEMLGRSLLGVMTKSEDPAQERFVFQQLSYENNNEYRAAVSAKCHILYNVSPNLSWELYRVDNDPMESRDIIDDPQGCENARGALAAWYERSEIPEGAMEALLSGPPETSEMSLQLGDAITLIDVEIPAQVKAGDSFDMVLTWKATGTPPAGWKVFAHFENPKGGRFTGDHAPVRPFSWWQEGQYIRYTHKINLQKSLKAGRYALWFGAYKKSDRLPASAEGIVVVDNRAQVATIKVVR